MSCIHMYIVYVFSKYLSLNTQSRIPAGNLADERVSEILTGILWASSVRTSSKNRFKSIFGASMDTCAYLNTQKGRRGCYQGARERAAREAALLRLAHTHCRI